MKVIKSLFLSCSAIVLMVSAGFANSQLVGMETIPQLMVDTGLHYQTRVEAESFLSFRDAQLQVNLQIEQRRPQLVQACSDRFGVHADIEVGPSFVDYHRTPDGQRSYYAYRLIYCVLLP